MSKSCQNCQKNNFQQVVKVVQKMSKSCQKLVKNLSKSGKNLSKFFQKVVKSSLKRAKIANFEVEDETCGRSRRRRRRR
jgi:uncharacterized membrane-anchored protein YhcB (DUF1043 family)